MKAPLSLLSLLLLGACAESSDGDVALSAATSSYATCGTLEASELGFTVVNQGTEPITLIAIEVQSATATGDLDFAEGMRVAPGESRTFTCVGGFDGQHTTASGPSSLTLHYTRDGAALTASGAGTHQTTQLFDNCDTGLPQREDQACSYAAD
jgi:hypothetical protein